VLKTSNSLRARSSFCVQALIDILQLQLLICVHAEDCSPARLEPVQRVFATSAARSMARSQRRGLIEEKQLRVLPRCHYLPVSATKLESTGNPLYALESPNNLPIRIVQIAAVAHHGASLRYRMKLAKWIYSILLRHE
jgi:hypothetical protein